MLEDVRYKFLKYVKDIVKEYQQKQTIIEE